MESLTSTVPTVRSFAFLGVAVAILGNRPLAALAQPESEPRIVSSGPLRFEEQLIRDNYGYAYGIAAADLDGDGDLDLTSSDTTNDLLMWFENDGDGNLTQRTIFDNDPGWFERHAVGDIDADGHLDVAIVKNKVGDLLWFENSGDPRNGELWSRHVITQGTLPGVYDVTLGDFDGDSDLDCAASSYSRGNLFAWYENHGDPESETEWEMHIIESDIGGTRTIEAADMNSDGRPDLLGTGRTAGLVLWYENTGGAGEALWRRRVIDDESPMPTHGHAVDMDGDGDLDVVLALGMLAEADAENTNHVAWYENIGRPGEGDEWIKHVVGTLNFAFEAVAGDLDGDGDVDIAATAWGGETGKLMWFENPSTNRSREWQGYVLKDNWRMANSVIIMDLDGDDRLDIAATAERGANQFIWWRNLGPADR